MFKHFLGPLFLSILLFSGGYSQPQAKWFKGNLHAHSYWSDGNDYPEMIMKWYKENNYQFAVLSEHNRFAEGDRWITPDKGTAHETAFQAYLEEFGNEWVEFSEKEENYRVRLKTLQEYRPLFEEEGKFCIIKSEEITDEYNGKPIHLNAANIQHLIEPQGGISVSDVIQNNINAVLNQRNDLDQPMFAHLNHPNFVWAVTAADYKKLEHARFFEVYNGHQLVNNKGDSLHQGTEEIWDEVNTYFAQQNKPLLYGVAVDDSHNYHKIDTMRANPGRGWVQVKSRVLHPDSLIQAMERGDFYASTGVRLQNISMDDKALSIRIDAEDGVEYTTQFIGSRIGSPENPGILFDEIKGTSAEYKFTGNELFVRAKIISDKLQENATVKGEKETAWVQPVKVE